ncbi:hypothetical protein OG900_09790 [Streptomyces sp. NBC_00433]
MPNPDFELYDNTGRSTDQIRAYNTGTPTADDLSRWDGAAAEPLIDAAELPPSGRSITGWTGLLGRAGTESELHGIAGAVLENDGALSRLHQFLESLANWYDERGDRTTSLHYQGLADQLDALADELVRFVDDTARRAYHRTRIAAARSGPAVPPPARPPAPPGARIPPLPEPVSVPHAGPRR